MTGRHCAPVAPAPSKPSRRPVVLGLLILGAGIAIVLIAPQAATARPAPVKPPTPVLTAAPQPTLIPAPMVVDQVAADQQIAVDRQAAVATDAPQQQRLAFIDAITRDGIDMAGRKDAAIDLAQLGAQSKAGDVALRQTVRTLFPQLNDAQDRAFVDAIHMAFPDAG